MEAPFRVLVVGAGAMGCLLGARFFQAGAQVLLLDVDQAHVAAICERGLELQELNGDRRKVYLRASCVREDPGGPADLVLVMLKSYATARALDLVFPDAMGPQTLFLSLQNGLGNGEILAELVGREKVLVGVTAQGATKEGPGRIRHGGEGPTFFGALSGRRPDTVQAVLALFQEAGLEATYREDIQVLIWEKLLVNVGINAVTALCGIPNGAIADLEPARSVCEAAVREAAAVAQAEGIPVSEDGVHKVLTVARATAANRSSMRQDVEAGRRTEIDAINGAVVRLAGQHGLAVPVNWALTQLVKVKEQSYGGKGVQA
ncbi:ketopantoate reductase [Desulfacinum hydrothermale DSM 13146]|uniref:2-dehydropantoate 2-reductase n=1 Tax=Desulfacinum hydrothermale DSM 13146 TaxID=1121390 RepID=A0A1W1XCA6_9BACT|nr:ketopantoate reductase family protein [Desulfacinum hydrothermale]SMC21499.1 ketopantoate reductase [Desulfacinum hydrothermale DSM 13146]